MTTRPKTKTKTKTKKKPLAIAVLRQSGIDADIVATPFFCGKRKRKGVHLTATFRALPPGKHGFHIHKAGDLRGEGCKGLCEHYDKGHHRHGAGPTSKKERHTGDLGNIQWSSTRRTLKKRYCLPNVSVQELWGRSMIVHADEDDLGKGHHEDSAITGHSGARIGCAIFGRAYE